MSETIAEATLADGRKFPYVVKDNPPAGGMKYTYFAPDWSYVIQFYHDPQIGADPNQRNRLEAILSRFNPTKAEAAGGAKGNDETRAAYFRSRFCWPVGMVVSPQYGVMCPTYPKNFLFQSGPLKGKEKKSLWFTSPKLRAHLDPSELGDFQMLLRMSLLLSRSIRRMHQAGLAHSDLSFNNVLVDPSSGECIVIDIDSLVVPGHYPPDVMGTKGYIAPEVLATSVLPPEQRKLPCANTDLHAMAVLLYEYLLCRHPLRGPKVNSATSAEEDDFLSMGSKALFIENPNDTSNRIKNLPVPIDTLGPALKSLFLRAFVDGLHNPSSRPGAVEWERALVAAWDLLHPCANASCSAKWFILHDVKNPVCPFCGTRLRNTDFLRLHMKMEARGRPGQWIDSCVLNVSHNTPLFKWHLSNGVFPDESADRTMQAYVCRNGGQWLLVNQCASGLTSPTGNIVPAGSAILLQNGTAFRTSLSGEGLLITVEQVIA